MTPQQLANCFRRSLRMCVGCANILATWHKRCDDRQAVCSEVNENMILYFVDRKVNVTGFSLISEATARNLWIRNDSRTSLSWCDLKPDSSMGAVSVSKMWPGVQTCLDSRKLGKLTACDL